MLNQLFAIFGTNASEPGWSLTDTALVIKVVIGVLAAAVGALPIAAARDAEKPAGRDRAVTRTGAQG
jgi:hypothetical protein